MLHTECEEVQAFRRAVCRVAPESGENFWLQVRKIVQSRSLSIMEFLDGCGMMGLAAHALLQQQGGSAMWYDLGRLVAFDMLINNFDRLPLAWTNEGNLSNLMLGSSCGPVVGIDQSITPMHAEGLRLYASRVRQAVVEARDGEAGAFGAVRQAVYNNTAIELTHEEVGSLRSGCLDFVSEVVRLSGTGELEESLQRVAYEVECLWPEHCVTKHACKLVNEVVLVFQDVLA